MCSVLLSSGVEGKVGEERAGASQGKGGSVLGWQYGGHGHKEEAVGHEHGEEEDHGHGKNEHHEQHENEYAHEESHSDHSEHGHGTRSEKQHDHKGAEHDHDHDLHDDHHQKHDKNAAPTASLSGIHR